jgi:hypothetical protein
MYIIYDRFALLSNDSRTMNNNVLTLLKLCEEKKAETLTGLAAGDLFAFMKPE